MTLDLLRRDPIVRTLPKWLVAGALVASALEGVRTLLSVKAAMRHETMQYELVWLAVILWLPLALFLAFGCTRQRCTRFDMTLPVTARRLWSTHLLAVTLSGAWLLALASAVVLLRDRLVAGLPGSPPVPRSDVFALALPFLAGLILAVVLLQAPHPSLYRIPNGWRHFVAVLFGAPALLGLVLALAVLPKIFVLVPLALAGFLLQRALRSVPPGFSLIPREPAEPPARESADGEERAAGQIAAWTPAVRPRRSAFARQVYLQWTYYGIFFRGIAPGQLWKAPVNLIQVPTLLLWGVIFSGAAIGNDETWLLFTIITVYLLFAFVPGAMSQLYMLDPLPVSRRAMFPLLVLPGLLAVFAGYGLGQGLILSRKPDMPATALTADRSSLIPPGRSKTAMVRVPAKLCGVSWTGRPPSLESSWGESHAAWSISIFPGSRAVLYSPYSTPADSSPEFVALQLSRAMSAVYGAAPSPGEMLDSFVEVDESGALGLREAALEDWRAERGLTPRAAPSESPLIFSVVGLMWLLTLWAYLGLFRRARTDAARKWIYFGSMGVLLAVHLVVSAVFIGDVVELWVAVGLTRILARHAADALPGGVVATWLLGIAAFLVLYRVVAGSFDKVEMPLPRAEQEP